MVKMAHNHATRANFRYDPTKAGLPLKHPSMMRFTEVVWHGEDDEGYCVYKKDPKTDEILRVDFLPPD